MKSGRAPGAPAWRTFHVLDVADARAGRGSASPGVLPVGAGAVRHRLRELQALNSHLRGGARPSAETAAVVSADPGGPGAATERWRRLRDALDRLADAAALRVIVQAGEALLEACGDLTDHDEQAMQVPVGDRLGRRR